MNQPVNPLLELRHAIKPSAMQRAQRHWRDRDKDFLLQRELAEMIPCSVSCVRDCEKEKRFPNQHAARQSAERLYEKHVKN